MNGEDDLLRDTTVFHVYCGSLSGYAPRVKAIRSIDVLQSVSLVLNVLNEKLKTIANRNLVCSPSLRVRLWHRLHDGSRKWLVIHSFTD
jgi:hypothetical protein